jgi:hypothetical protein
MVSNQTLPSSKCLVHVSASNARVTAAVSLIGTTSGVFFLGKYASTDQNILYLDLDMELVECSHHAQFDEAWYLQPHRLPTAQLLYDLGLEADDDPHIRHDDQTSDTTTMDVNIIPLLPAPWPPIPPAKLSESKWCVPDSCRTTLLSLRETAISRPITVAAT